MGTTATFLLGSIYTLMGGGSVRLVVTVRTVVIRLCQLHVSRRTLRLVNQTILARLLDQATDRPLLACPICGLCISALRVSFTRAF